MGKRKGKGKELIGRKTKEKIAVAFAAVVTALLIYLGYSTGDGNKGNKGNNEIEQTLPPAPEKYETETPINIDKVISGINPGEVTPSIMEELEWLEQSDIEVVYGTNFGGEYLFLSKASSIYHPVEDTENQEIIEFGDDTNKKIILDPELKAAPDWLQAILIAKEASHLNPKYRKEAESLAVKIFKKSFPEISDTEIEGRDGDIFRMMLNTKGFRTAWDAMMFLPILPDIANNASKIDAYFNSLGQNDSIFMPGVYLLPNGEEFLVLNTESLISVLLQEGILEQQEDSKYVIPKNVKTNDSRVIDVLTSLFFGINNNLEGYLNDSEGSLKPELDLFTFLEKLKEPYEQKTSLVDQLPSLELENAQKNLGNGILPHILLAYLNKQTNTADQG